MAERSPPREAARNAFVNSGDRYRVMHWAKLFGVSEDRLLAAIRVVGARSEDVAVYLATMEGIPVKPQPAPARPEPQRPTPCPP